MYWTWLWWQIEAGCENDGERRVVEALPFIEEEIWGIDFVPNDF
jgi:hypothetical protein